MVKEATSGRPVRVFALVWTAGLVLASMEVIGAVLRDGVVALKYFPNTAATFLLPALCLGGVIFVGLKVLTSRLESWSASLLRLNVGLSWRQVVLSLSLPLSLYPVAVLLQPVFEGRYNVPLVPSALSVTMLGTVVMAGLVLRGVADLRCVSTALALTWGALLILAGPFLSGVWSHLVLIPLVCAVLAGAAWGVPRGRAAVLMLALAPVMAMLPKVEVFSGHALMMRQGSLSGYYADWSRLVLDFDRDGSSTFFGGADCNDFDAELSPFNVEIVGNGLDDNCMGGDLAQVPDPMSPLSPKDFAIAAPKRVIVITIDTLRHDYVGEGRRGRSLTPNIDRFASESVVFKRAYSNASYTLAAFSTFWTSATLISTDIQKTFLGYELTLAELLSSQGYQTTAVMSLAKMPWNIVLGFEVVDTLAVDQDAGFLQKPAARTVARAEHWIDQMDPDEPNLLWVHFIDPHSPYYGHDGEDGLRDDKEGRYSQEVAHTDHHLGLLVDKLKARGLWDDSIVVLFSDHGELLGEHGLYEHAFTLHEEVVRIPMMVKAPGVTAREVTDVVSLMDLAPTLLELLGAPKPTYWRGRSLVPVMEGRPLPKAPISFMTGYDKSRLPKVGLVEDPWKYVVDLHNGMYYLSRVDGPDTDVPVVNKPQLERMQHLMGQIIDESLNDVWVRRKLHYMKERGPRLPKTVHGQLRPLNVHK